VQPRGDELTGWALLVPSVLLIGLLVYYPALVTLRDSLTGLNLRIPNSGSWVALGNYAQLLSTPEFWGVLGRSLLVVLFVLPAALAIGLGAALVLNQPFPGRGIVRTLAILPWMLPPLVNGFMWSWILNGDYGALNGLLYQLRFIGAYQHWLAHPAGQIFWVGVAQAWTRYPFSMVVLLAALQSIPDEIYDAARIDGSGPWQLFRAVTFPMLMPAFAVALTVEFIATFQIFDVIWSLTGGGAAGSVINPFTKTVMLYNYELVFRNLEIGLGSALAYLILIVSLGIGYIFVRNLYEKALA